MDGTLLPAEVIRALDHDAILDARDGDADFEAHWTECYKEVNAKWATANIDPLTAELSKDIRRESFLSVSRATTQHEIASYVSDDFEIMIKSAILGLDDDFISYLWEAYGRNEIPSPKSAN